jgi:hypothetical protein
MLKRPGGKHAVTKWVTRVYVTKAGNRLHVRRRDLLRYTTRYVGWP